MSLRRRIAAFGYAFKGLVDLIRNTPNARIHLAATFIVVAGGTYFSVSPTEWCLLLLCIGAVFSAEAFNTALEYLTDLVSPGHHPLAGKAKDMAAAAVLLIAIVAAMIGTIIFLPYLL